MLRPSRMRGFTLIELMVVISIILILTAISVPRYELSARRTKEAALRSNLFTLRTTIQQFAFEKQRAPQSLDELVSAGYLGEIPLDPITNSRSTWVVTEEDPMRSADPTTPGIIDVHSGSGATALDGTPYSSW